MTRSFLLLVLTVALTITLTPSIGWSAFEHQAYLKSVAEDEVERGRSVAVSGRYAAMSAWAGDRFNNVLIYERQSDGTWAFGDLVKAENADPEDDYGRFLALDGRTLVVGAPDEDSAARGIDGEGDNNDAPDSGAVYVYVRAEDGTWRLEAYIKSANSDAGDRFGSAVSLDGDTLVVGAPGEDSDAEGVGGEPGDNSLSTAGAAYVFVRSEDGWEQQAYLKASASDSGDAFGSAVAVYQDWVVVGAPFERSAATGSGGNDEDNSIVAAGAVYPYVRQGQNWQPLGYLKASNSDTADLFGTAVDIVGSPTPFGTELMIAVGAPGESSNAVGVGGNQLDNSADDAGAVYLILGNGVGGWGQVGYLKASNTGPDDEFGRVLALAAGQQRRILVGASREDSIGTGVDGVQADNSATQSGAAYLFIENDLVITQEHYLKASNTNAGDRFGFAVAMDRDLILIGAPLEDSGALGVDGDQSDNSRDAAGAAYLLARPDGLFQDRFMP